MSSSGALVPGPGVTATPVTNNSNMYRVGDYVFFENSASGPYAIRRIEELNKTQNGELIIADEDIINLLRRKYTHFALLKTYYKMMTFHNFIFQAWSRPV